MILIIECFGFGIFLGVVLAELEISARYWKFWLIAILGNTANFLAVHFLLGKPF